MKRLFLGLIFLLILVKPSISDSIQTPAIRPYYGGIHFAGNTGLFSVSFGKKFFKECLILSVGYGYLPESVNGVEVHTILIRTTYHFNKGLILNKINWYTGFTGFYGITENTFINLPSQYPDDYYAANALHVSPYIGLRMPLNFYKPLWAKKAYFHMELGAVDTYLWYFIINKRVKFWDVCNTSFGIYYTI